MEKTINVFFTNSYFSVGDEGEMDINRFLEDSNEMANFVDKILDKFYDQPSISYTGNTYRYFRIFKQVNRSDNGRGANAFSIILEYKGVNCYKPSGKSCFLKCISFFSRKILRRSFSKSNNRIK